jgi:glycosyltransferase involved in cell wall biosynthesis
MVTFIIPTRNNLPYLKLAYNSIRTYYPTEEIIILDDNSTDGTMEWVDSCSGQSDQSTIYYKNGGRQVGHTVLYDKGVELADNEIFTIFHADMVCGPNYVENLMKHLKPQWVVAATRIEPPLHPPGKEKIVKDFGTYVEDFKGSEFVNYCHSCQQELTNKDITTQGIFAPWMMYKQDFIDIGGHDKFFAPFPYEDSDIFQRFVLTGYDIKQSRDAFVYHFTCRGHRWTEQVQKDDYFYKLCCAKNMSHFIRKWGSWVENDENCFPVIKPKYDIGFVVKNCSLSLLGMLEPWCSTIYCDAPIEGYINQVQPGTPFIMKRRVRRLDTYYPTNDIIIEFDGSKFNQEHFSLISNLPKILEDSGELGVMEFDIFKFTIQSLKRREPILISNETAYGDSLRELPKSDPYCLDEMFNVFHKTRSVAS